MATIKQAQSKVERLTQKHKLLVDKALTAQTNAAAAAKELAEAHAELAGLHGPTQRAANNGKPVKKHDEDE